MKKEGYYSSGQFAGMAHVTLRTIRYYDKQGILKPSFVNESGARFYTDEDFARLQQILLLKYLGFSLDDIREMIVEPHVKFDPSDWHGGKLKKAVSKCLEYLCPHQSSPPLFPK